LDLYFYEGRTIRGAGLMTWALLVELGAVVVTGLTLVALAVMLGPALESPGGLGTSALTALAAVCGVAGGQVAMAVLFLVGFHEAYAGRHEYGLRHANSVERALVFLMVYFVVTAVGYLYSVTNSLLQPGLAGLPAVDLLSGNAILAPVGALFAGLTLYYAGRTLADPPVVRRLRTALTLGVAGAVAGPLLLAFAVSGALSDLHAIVSGLLASAVAGQGVSALSLLLFLLAFRDIRHNLEAGKPAPVLPRIDQAYPWVYRQEYSYPQPPAANPPPPPKP
jgi:hypothetical protein